MSPVVLKGLQAILCVANPETGLTHPSDMSAAIEMFVQLHKAGEPLVANEIMSFAVHGGWQVNDAKKLGKLGAEIGVGKKKRVCMPYGTRWPANLVEQWQSEAGSEDASQETQ